MKVSRVFIEGSGTNNLQSEVEKQQRVTRVECNLLDRLFRSVLLPCMRAVLMLSANSNKV